jgi:hypothetical protein
MGVYIHGLLRRGDKGRRGLMVRDKVSVGGRRGRNRV